MLVKSLAFVGAANAAIRSREGTHHASVEDYTIGSVDLSNFITSWNYTMVSLNSSSRLIKVTELQKLFRHGMPHSFYDVLMSIN